jgi:hypothetical protein
MGPPAGKNKTPADAGGAHGRGMEEWRYGGVEVWGSDARKAAESVATPVPGPVSAARYYWSAAYEVPKATACLRS